MLIGDMHLDPHNEDRDNRCSVFISLQLQKPLGCVLITMNPDPLTPQWAPPCRYGEASYGRWEGFWHWGSIDAPTSGLMLAAWSTATPYGFGKPLRLTRQLLP